MGTYDPATGTGYYLCDDSGPIYGPFKHPGDATEYAAARPGLGHLVVAHVDPALLDT